MGKQSIKVTIAGRIYPISVQADEEDMVRRAAAKVEENIKDLSSNFAVKDKQDLLAMTALQMTTEMLKFEVSPASSVSESELDTIESLIDSML